jgi:replicative DNA helicase
VGEQGTVHALNAARAAPAGLPPHSVAAEQAVIGAIMVRNALFDELEGTLRPEHFYVPLHGAAFEAIEHLINVRGVEANPISIDAQLKESSFGKQGNLFAHLTAMFESAALTGDIKSVAQVIQNTYIRRQLMGLADSMKRQAESAATQEATSLVVAQAGDELYRLQDTGTVNTTSTARVALREMLAQAQAAKAAGGGLTGVTTGFTDLDRLLGGLQKSDLIILGARPSMGKTSLLLNIAHHAAARMMAGETDGAAVAMFSLEMSRTQLMQRIAAAAAGINSQQIANGQMSDANFNTLVGAAGEMANLPLLIDDGAGLTVQQVHVRARQMKRKHGIGLVVVDYLQLMRAPSRRNDQNRVQEVSEISQGLKQMARELDVPVLVASQLSRYVETRDNKRPLLSDLRESGSIEQDADVVAFLYRDEYYISRELGGASETDAATDADRRKVSELKDRLSKMRGLAELIVSKNRKGPTDTVRLLFQAETTCFHNFAEQRGSWNH